MWSEVVRGGRKRPPRTTIAAEKTALLRKRVSKTSAVIIDHPAGVTTLTSVMQKIAANVDLRALGVNVITTRITKTGGILLELDAAEDADKLANSIKGVIGELARVSRPQRRTPVLIVGIPDWEEENAVKSSLTQAGVAPQELVNDGKCTISLRDSPGGGGARVARLDVSYPAALTLAGIGHVVVGWTRCRVKLLEKRKATCYKCQEQGYIAAKCKGQARPRRCYRCNTEGHLVGTCPGPANNGNKSLPFNGANAGDQE